VRGEKGGRKEEKDALDAEGEVELPRADPRCQLTVFVGQSDTELDDPEQVDVAPQRLVVVVA